MDWGMAAVFLAAMLAIPFCVGLLLRVSSLQRLRVLLRRVIAAGEAVEAYWLLWIFGILSFMLMRDYLENFSVGLEQIYNPLTRIEYALFWVPIPLAMSLLLFLLSGERLSRTSRLIVLFWPVTLLPPIVDFIASRGKGIATDYIFNDLSREYLGFMNISSIAGPATLGIKLEILVVCALLFIYVLLKSRSLLRAALTPLFGYSLIFFFFVTPKLVSLLTGRKLFVGHFNLYMILTHLALFVAFGMVWLVVYYRQEGSLPWTRSSQPPSSLSQGLPTAGHRRGAGVLRAVASNLRLSRILHYALLTCGGFLLALLFLQEGPTGSQLLHLALLLLGVSCAWLFAVFLNDIFDVETDRISESSRPLVSGSLSARQHSVLSGISFILAMLFSLLAGYAAWSFVLFFVVVYSFIYSAPPYRLRRFLLLPNVLIGLASAAAMLAGFSIIYGEHALRIFPRDVLLMVVLAYTLSSTVKDLKDLKGDKLAGIRTLFTLLGELWGRFVCGLLLFTSYLLVPIFISTPSMWILGATGGALAFAAMQRLGERAQFIIEALFLAALFLMLANLTAGTICQSSLFSTSLLKDVCLAPTDSSLWSRIVV